MNMILAAVYVFAAVNLLSATAAELHVAPDGDDANPGTAGRPFATVERARDAARGAVAPNTILLAPGRYFLANSLVLDERDSGLTIKGEKPGAVAEVYGGVPVAGWEKWKNNIWRAKVPVGTRFFNLVVDGKSATMAQTPNKGSGFGGGAWRCGNGAVGVPKEWRGYDYSDAQVFCFIGGNWFSEMREVLKPSPDANGVLPVDGGSGQFGGMNGRFFIRGVLQFLDEPGEWCLKHQEGYVYYWPKSGAPSDHLIVRPTSQRLVDVHGSAMGKPARNIALENLSLIGSDFCVRWYLFGHNQDGWTPAPLQQGLVFGENVEGLKISGCKIVAAGHSGVWLNHYAQNCVVENCLIMEAGFAGIYANGFMPGEGPFKSGSESYVNKGHRIEDNFIYDCGQFIGGGCGIQLYQAGDSLITRNEIGQMPRYGISFKGIIWKCIPKKLYGHTLTFDAYFDYLHTRNLKVVGNEIYSVCRNSFDFGGIESWGSGRDNLWESNDLHDIDQTLDWNGWAHVLFPDDASHYLTIRDNILHHCRGGSHTGGMMMKSLCQTIENNLVADCTLGRVISLSAYVEPSGGYVIRHNIFASDGNSSRYAEQPEVFTGYAGNAGTLPPGVGGIKELDHNLITPRDPANPNNLADKGVDTRSFFGDPKLLRAKPDWDMTAREYSLAPDSPAFKLGIKPIDAAAIGLKSEFPFDKLAATRRLATDKIQAEEYQRTHEARTSAGVGLYNLVPGAWTKYANIDFGDGKLSKAIFHLQARKAEDMKETFFRRYGDTTVFAEPFSNSGPTYLNRWELSGVYKQAGKKGSELFDIPFAPEKDIAAGEWKPWLSPTTSRAGVTSPPNTVDLDVALGEGINESCAYLRTSVFNPKSNDGTLAITFECASGVKLWLNGELILAANTPGIHKTDKAVFKPGWNTFLVKVNQDDGALNTPEKPLNNFRAKMAIESSLWPCASFLPGLPATDKAKPVAGDLLELRLDSPVGRCLGRLPEGAGSCPVEKVSGVHSLYLVFPGRGAETLDWFKLE